MNNEIADDANIDEAIIQLEIALRWLEQAKLTEYRDPSLAIAKIHITHAARLIGAMVDRFHQRTASEQARLKHLKTDL